MLTDSPVLTSDSFGLEVWSSWSFLKLLWQRLVVYCDSVAAAAGPQSEQKQKSHFNIFLITLPGGTADWAHLNIFDCISTTSASKQINRPSFIFCAISQINDDHIQKLERIFFPEERLCFMSDLFFCLSYAHFILLSQGPYSLTKPQHASLEFIVDVVLLLWVKIVMSCPHLTSPAALGHLRVGGCFT